MAGRYPSKAVANWMLDRFRQDCLPMTQLQLNKLVYIAHGWHLAMDPEEAGFISEHIVAWKYGPVVPSLRDEFREFGSRPITRLADDWIGPFDKFTPQLTEYEPLSWETRLLEWVFRRYGHLSGPQLIELTHQPESPWWRATEGGRFIGANKVISDDIIREHYFELLQKITHPHA